MSSFCAFFQICSFIVSNKVLAFAAATAMFLPIANIQAEAAAGFRDVPDNASYAEAVQYCADNGLMTGTSDTEFSPDGDTTRAMLVTILHRHEGTPSASTTAVFSDVEAGMWYSDAVNWAAENDIITGYDSEHFGPKDTLQREQIITILWRIDGENAGAETIPYSDSASISDYAKTAIAWALENGIIDASGSALEPAGNVNRAEMATMLYRYLSTQDTPNTTGPEDTSATNPSQDSSPDTAEIPDVHVTINSRSGEEFDVILYESTAASALMTQVPDTQMMLPPSYDQDGVCKYYEIPSRYLPMLGIEVESVSSVKAGDMLLAEDGKLYLYYKDADVSGEYQRIGRVVDPSGLEEKLGDSDVTFYVTQYDESAHQTGSANSAGPAPSQGIALTESVTELENGFSAVRFDGDYLFENFLQNGGASSDAELADFLQKNIAKTAGSLQINTKAFGCSTISAAGQNGTRLFGRNFDWNRCNALVVSSKPSDGYASLSTVNTDFISSAYRYGYNALPERIRTMVSLYAPLDGINEKGLCAAVLMIQDNATINQITDKPDITTTTAIRLLLNKAANVDEALRLLEQYDMHASFGYMVHFALADTTGRSVVVEYIDNKMEVIETPVVTNFYIAEGSKHGVGTQQSHTRFDILTKTLADNSVMNMEQMKDAMDSVSKDNFGEFESTEWSIVYNQNSGEAVYYHRENYDKSYLFRIGL